MDAGEGNSEMDEFLRIQITKALRNEGASGEVQLEVKHDTQKGEHFLSITSSIKGTGKKSDGKKICIPFFIKSCIKNEIWRQGYNADAVFQREVDFYTVILPAFEDFQRRHLQLVGEKSEENALSMIPKCFSAVIDGTEGAILLEDLMEEGYGMLDRAKGLDLEKSFLVMRSLAKFHSFSHAMKQKEPDTFRHLCDYTEEVFFEEKNEKTLAKSFQTNALAVIEATRKYHPEAADKVKEWLKDGNFQQISRIARERDEYSVINHSDTWINNLLFRKSAEKRWEVKFVDYQMIRYCTPVADLSYFLMTSVEPSVRESYLELLLREYHATLMKWCVNLGCSDPVNVFPFHQLEIHMKKYCFYGLGLALMFLPLYYTAPDESPNLEGYKDTSMGHLTKLHEVGMAKEVALQRMVSLVKHCYDCGYI